MTAEENRVPLPTEFSPSEAEADPQLSACAQEGLGIGGFPSVLYVAGVGLIRAAGSALESAGSKP